ncbi:MAG: hypothetical protein NC548_29770 [Lachnospiraceae bacterium]|nr:hypothetical protein [Lachnospiraceae bacterium]
MKKRNFDCGIDVTRGILVSDAEHVVQLFYNAIQDNMVRTSEDRGGVRFDWHNGYFNKDFALVYGVKEDKVFVLVNNGDGRFNKKFRASVNMLDSLIMAALA